MKWLREFEFKYYEIQILRGISKTVSYEFYSSNINDLLLSELRVISLNAYKLTETHLMLILLLFGSLSLYTFVYLAYNFYIIKLILKVLLLPK